MPIATRKCKVCGAEYPYCKTAVNDSIFRYQDVACCPEHGSLYFAQILASRSTNKNAQTETVPVRLVDDHEEWIDDDFDDEEDDDFEDEFDDDDDEE